MLAVVRSATLLGIAGEEVAVEVHAGPGLPGFTVVGLPDATCREARDRVRAAILSSGLSWPQERVTVNLAPSGLRKVGAGLDLAIAVGVLVASEQAEHPPQGFAFIGELGLDGSVRPVLGILPMAASLQQCDLVVPTNSAAEAMLLTRHRVRPVVTLREVVACLSGAHPWPTPAPVENQLPAPISPPDLSEVRGNRIGRLALEVAAAGGHHLLMSGPPGAGKTMLAERLVGLLNDLSPDRSLEATMIRSAAGLRLVDSGLETRPPFRNPHHTLSQVALIGGGSQFIRPGEISLAHGGVLFLDELGEFAAPALDALRQPLEEGVVRIHRAHASATLPASFQLVAAMNPCPCGFAGTLSCRCSSAALMRYQRRLSGPLIDRFDLRILIERTDSEALLAQAPSEPTAVVAARVAGARDRAMARGVESNRHLSSAALEKHSRLDPPARALLGAQVTAGKLSGRGVRRVRTVALTLDDLAEGTGVVTAEMILLALALRSDLLADTLGGAAHEVVGVSTNSGGSFAAGGRNR